jgi:serine/threonine protein kinase
LVPGARLDRYELLCPIAQGGMAQVWVARMQGRHGFEKLYAVKMILAQHAADPRFQRMFLDEARIIASIRHPNVAQILDLGEMQDLLYLMLEWIEGDSLSALRRIVHSEGRRLPLAIALRVVSDTLSGLHAAHEVKSADGRLRGVVHRDVSPANVLLSTSGEVKVIDFGVAKAIDRLSEETSAGVIKGKIAYMAPEQALGKEVDRRADIWAAGAMLYQLLTGRAPYEGENQLATLARLVKGLPPERIRGVPDKVAQTVYTALAYTPEGRYSTADEMHRELEGLIVELCGPTTQADVAAYVNDKLADRIARRQRTIERAFDAAQHRADVAAEFDASVTSSHSIAVIGELRTPTIDRERLDDLEREAVKQSGEASARAARASFDEAARASHPELFSTGSSPEVLPAGQTVPRPQPAAEAKLPTSAPAASAVAPDLDPLLLDSTPPPGFGTRRRGPLVAVGFAAALVLLGYGAWLAYDRIQTERELSAPSP